MSPHTESTTLTLDPAWPWSIPGVGLYGLLFVALALIGLTIWTYQGVSAATPRRVFILLALRLAALLLACVAVLRPSLAFQEEPLVPSTLHLAADSSASMTIQDQHANLSRWDYLCRLLRDCEPQLQQLRDEQKVSVVLYRFAGDVAEFDPNGKAEGKRTDFGELLNTLFERHGSERNLRGLLILSDGADNGTRFPPLALAPKWRSAQCPIHTFGFGQTTTALQQRDIALVAINPTPSPVAIKNQLKVKGIVDRHGFPPCDVNLRLFVDDQQVAQDKVRLANETGNEVQLTCDAPARPGEIKVTLKIDPVRGEISQANNEISTYVTATKEGISVLYVEGKYRAWEPKFIRYALSQEPSIRLFESVRLTDRADDTDLFNLEKQHYDVIIIGDVSARRFSGSNPEVLATIARQVNDKGAGLLMIGGYESFGNSDWDNTPIGRLLPVRLTETGQVDGPVQMAPTSEGLRHYVMRLAENEADNARVWNSLPRLDGMTKIGTPKPGAQVLARSKEGEPILVGEPSHGAGRTLVFAGDTTWRWRRTEEGARAQARFWRQVVFWLAKRDEAEGNVVILPDTRRLPAGGKLGFIVKLRGKGGVDVPEKDAHFDVTVTGPDGQDVHVPTARERGEERGIFWKTDASGEYTLNAKGWGTDTDGIILENLPPAKVRFVVYQDEAELARQAADHDFLAKLASAGGGRFHLAEDLKTFLRELTSQPLPQSKTKAKLWPDWRRTAPSRTVQEQMSALTASGILACFLLFVTLLCLEWFFRRYWGLV
jgi:uncharacterized membrane protein